MTERMIEDHYVRSAAYPEFEMEAKWIEHHLPDGDSRILEMGCGGGGMLARLAPRRVLGVDPFPRGLAIARQVATDAPLVCADGHALPFARGSFDAVIVQHVVEHLSAATTAAREWNRVLNPGGVLLLVTPNARFCDPSVFADDTHVRIFGHGELRALATGAGFAPVDLRTLGLPWFRRWGGRPGLWRLRRSVIESAPRLSQVAGLRWCGQSLCCAAIKEECG
ncbi:MAG: class I SAM-dependent methyltransferase [bacterium]|nr:class I SAM-dependent methyltransferase [bacterium]